MKAMTAYLTFDGNCREAMSFYSECLGGKLEVMTLRDMPGASPAAEDRIIHSCLSEHGTTLMASDNMEGMEFKQGNNSSILIECESKEEVDRLFKCLGEGGNVMMATQETFWGAYYGMLTDKFGTNWRFNCNLEKKG